MRAAAEGAVENLDAFFRPRGVAVVVAKLYAGLRPDLLSALLNLGYHRPLAEKAVEAGAAMRVADADALTAAAAALLCDPARRARMREAAAAFLGAHRGATERLWVWLGDRVRPSAPR